MDISTRFLQDEDIKSAHESRSAIEGLETVTFQGEVSSREVSSEMLFRKGFFSLNRRVHYGPSN